MAVWQCSNKYKIRDLGAWSNQNRVKGWGLHMMARKYYICMRDKSRRWFNRVVNYWWIFSGLEFPTWFLSDQSTTWAFFWQNYHSIHDSWVFFKTKWMNEYQPINTIFDVIFHIFLIVTNLRMDRRIRYLLSLSRQISHFNWKIVGVCSFPSEMSANHNFQDDTLATAPPYEGNTNCIWKKKVYR